MADASLDGIELLQSLSTEECAKLAKRCRWRRCERNEQIIDRDSDDHEVYFVVSGKVRVMDVSETGREISFVDIPAGGLFGELAAIDGRTRSANVIALTDTVVAALPARAFVELLQEHPSVSLAVLRHLATIIRESSRRIMDLSVHSAQARVMTELLHLGLAASQDGDSGRISPLPPHADIASRVSTTRETVARVVSDLVKSGIARKSGHDLIIEDLAALSERAQELPH